MLDTLREIGIFMIAAQAVIHFAPGKQYEKYIKSVAGIIVLLLFLNPFLQLSGAEWKGRDAILKKLEEVTDMPDFSEGEQDMAKEQGAGKTVVSRMEAEVKDILNRELNGDDFRVKRVSFRFAGDTAHDSELRLSQIEIGMVRASEAGEERTIGVDRIVIGSTADEEDKAFAQYRSRFAALLGIEEERVEVRLDGRG